MAIFNKFNSFIEAVAEGKHNFASDQLKVALTDTAPTATDAVLADIDEIAYTNLSSRDLTISASSQTSGVYSLVIADLLLSATGDVEKFRYVVVYNDDAPSDELVAFFDYGASITMRNGETFNLDFSTLFTLV